MSRVNLHIYPSPFTHESRIQKVTKSMADAGLVDQVFLVGVWEEGLPETQQLDEKRQIWRVKPKLGSQQSGLFIKTLRYIEWQLRIFFRFINSPVKYVNCHSLPVLPLGVLFKIIKRTRLIYDTHELETEGAGSVGIKRMLYKAVEGSMIRFSDAVFTVNESISEWYRRTYSLKSVTAVRNIPYKSDHAVTKKEHLLRQKYNLPDEAILFIFQGSFGPGRGIEILLDVFSQVEPSKHIVFMGFGDLEKSIKECESRHMNIHFQPGVSPEEVGRYTQGADVGLCLQENIGLNYYLSLPNKLFEYLLNGVPAIVSDFPEMVRVIEQGDCGWKVPVDCSELFRLVASLTWEEINRKRRNALEYSQTLGWQEEEKALLRVYQSLENARN